MSVEKFNPKDFEKKWQDKWIADKLYKTGPINNPKGKYYSLYSYPYPSGSGLHVGHVEGMVANDIVARYYRLKGRSVTLPMGWDAFGLPAENYAIKTGVPPKQNTDNAIKTFIEQINNVGIAVDWDMEVGSHEPRYYKWTQWIFLQLFKAGLAYRKNAPVNWCPKDETVLANEQVVDGKCERCDTEVVQKEMEQWFFKITDYADRLDKDLKKIDWPESTKAQQRNWIGKSVGAEIVFELVNENSSNIGNLNVFTTRADTIYSGAFLVIAPESSKVLELKSHLSNVADIDAYILKTQGKTELERQQEKDKTGVKLEGVNAINPANGEIIPVFLGDFVLSNYGSGVIFGDVHDERDFEFVKKFKIKAKPSIIPEDPELAEKVKNLEVCFTDYGTLIDSEEFTGMKSEEAKTKIIEKLKKQGKAKSVINFRIRDWLVSRQRYWGAPIPIVYDPQGVPHAMNEKDLPLLLPEDVDFKPTGESPITRSESFKKLAEEKYGKGWHFEVDTMDTFVDSSWYFLRYFSTNDDEKIFDSEVVNYWLPTDLYMIGAEHTVLHLLYSRFFTKFFFDQGLINFDEPFYFMRHMGTIQGTDNRKMSKRWGNVLNPNDEIDTYGADTLRMYEMFMGPIDEAKPWNDRAENGVSRFLAKIWELQAKVSEVDIKAQNIEINKTIKKVGGDIEVLSFNTAVAKLMELVNFLSKESEISKEVWKSLLIILAPFAPFITEELWERAGWNYSVHQQSWPEFNEELTRDAIITMAIQVNGKIRSTIDVQTGTDEMDVRSMAMEIPLIQKYIIGEPKRVIFVKDKIINFIV